VHRQGQSQKPYKFGVKSAVVVSHDLGLMLGARTLPGNPYNSHIQSGVLEQAANLTQCISANLKQINAGHCTPGRRGSFLRLLLAAAQQPRAKGVSPGVSKLKKIFAGPNIYYD
jgi:hypothetical protein